MTRLLLPGPAPWEGTAGSGSEAQLELIRAETFSSHESSVLGSWTTNGYLILNVFYDDGALQGELDAKYGPKLVLVQWGFGPSADSTREECPGGWHSSAHPETIWA
jgi:hypothetical protein